MTTNNQFSAIELLAKQNELRSTQGLQPITTLQPENSKEINFSGTQQREIIQKKTGRVIVWAALNINTLEIYSDIKLDISSHPNYASSTINLNKSELKQLAEVCLKTIEYILKLEELGGQEQS